MNLTNIMNQYTLNMFNTGQVTLPKSWRSKFNTKHFLAQETKDGLLLKPILKDEDVVFYENDHSFGLIFPNGIDPQVLIDEIKKIDG